MIEILIDLIILISKPGSKEEFLAEVCSFSIDLCRISALHLALNSSSINWQSLES